MTRSRTAAAAAAADDPEPPAAPKHSIVVFRGLHPTPSTSLTPLALSPSPPTPFYSVPATKTSPRRIVELSSCKTPYTSWLLRLSPSSDASDVVIDRCGDVAFLSTIDPLFAAIPILASRRTVDGRPSFQPADDLLVDVAGVCLAGAVSPTQMALVCEMKVAGDESFYKLCDTKVLRWLRRKVDVLAKAALGSRTEALEIVCRYLGEENAGRLRAEEGDGEVVEVGDGAALAYQIMADAAKVNAENGKAIEDEWARKREGEKGDSGSGIPAPKKRKTGGTGSKLDKVDKRGLQSMKSFFGST